MADVIAPKRKKLSDLFVTGTEVEFADGSDNPPKVWIQKLTPHETQEAADKARPEKMKILSIRRLPDDDPAKLRYIDEVESTLETKDDMISFVIADKIEKASISAQEEIAAKDEWAKDDYLEGLQAAWRDELKDKYFEDQEDEEAVRVFEQLQKYTNQVTDEIKARVDDLKNEVDHLDEETLKTRCVKKLIGIYSDSALLETFQRYQLYFAVRDPESHSKRYFGSPEEIDGLQGPVLEKLRETYTELSVDGFEGKDQAALLIFCGWPPSLNLLVLVKLSFLMV